MYLFQPFGDHKIKICALWFLGSTCFWGPSTCNDKNVTILALLREGYNFIDILNSNSVRECTEETQAKYLNSSN